MTRHDMKESRMPTTRLSRSIPFWVLVAGSVVAIAGVSGAMRFNAEGRPA